MCIDDIRISARSEVRTYTLPSVANQYVLIPANPRRTAIQVTYGIQHIWIQAYGSQEWVSVMSAQSNGATPTVISLTAVTYPGIVSGPLRVYDYGAGTPLYVAETLLSQTDYQRLME